MSNRNAKLSSNFTIGELIRSEAAERHGIDNFPDSDDVINALQELAINVLEPIRSEFGPFRPNSGYRSQKVNALVGSKSTSQHTKGQAADIEVPGIHNIELAKWISKYLDFDQLLLEFVQEDEPAAGWVHVSYVSHERNRRQVLRVTKSGTVPYSFK